MKRKIVWSLTAMLAGTGLATAQENIELASVRMANGNAARTGTIAQHESAVGCSTDCSSFGNNYRIYGRGEVLVWQLGSSLSDNGGDNLPSFRQTMPYGFRTASYNLTDPLNPILLETKDISGLAQLDPSILAGSGLDGLDRMGGRITLGMFLDSNRDWSAELTYFQLEQKGTQYLGVASVNNIQFITGLNDVIIEVTPGQNGNPNVTNVVETPVMFNADFAATITGTTNSRFFGVETNVNHRTFTVGNTVVSEIYGLRYLDLTINQTLAQAITVTDDRYIIDNLGFPNSSTTVLFGDYQAHNQFYAAQVGLKFDSDYGRFFMTGFGKFAFGAMRQDLSINEDVFNTEIDIPFSVYPAPTVIRENRTRLAFALEGNLSAGFHITDNISILAGYNVLVMTRVARLNGNSVPASGPGTISLGDAENPIPVSPVFKEGRYYAHGLNLGLEFRY